MDESLIDRIAHAFLRVTRPELDAAQFETEESHIAIFEAARRSASAFLAMFEIAHDRANNLPTTPSEKAPVKKRQTVGRAESGSIDVVGEAPMDAGNSE